MKSYSNERERLLLGVNKESIGKPGIKNPVLPFTPGEGMQYGPYHPSNSELNFYFMV